MSMMNKFSYTAPKIIQKMKICESSCTNHVLRVSYPRRIECKNKHVHVTPAYINMNVPNSVPYLVRSPIFGWHVFTCESQNEHEKTCVQKENRLHAQDLLTILSSTFNIIRKTHLIISWLGHFWLWKVITTTQEIKSLPHLIAENSHITFADPRIPHSEIQAENHGKQVWLSHLRHELN